MTSKPKATGSRTTKKAIVRKLVDSLAEADVTPAKIADDLHVSMEQLASVALDDRTIRTLQGIARLADVQAQMLLSRYRVNAAMHLITIASAGEATEIARKACVDLLNMNLKVFEPDENNRDSDLAPAPSEEAILDALEQLGERTA